jgi:hypothetical protein
MTNQAIRKLPPSPEDPRLVAFLTHVSELLVPGERIEAWAVQRRLFALMSRRALAIATTGRLLVLTRKLFAGYDLTDVRWQDLSSTRIKVGMFGADVSVGYLDGTDLTSANRSVRWRTIAGLRSAQAQEVYRLCQAHDQAWREKRRIRDLEEMRARAGGVQIGGGVAGALPGPGGSDDPTDRLQRAKDMVLKGLITDAEYEGIKAKIISGL